MHVIGELDDVFGKEVYDETSRGGGTLVIICSRGNFSMASGADVGFEAPSADLSIEAGGRAGAANLSKNDRSKEAAGVISSAPAAGALLGEPCCEVCCDWGQGSIDRLSGSWANADWVKGRGSTDRRGTSDGWWMVCDRGIV